MMILAIILPVMIILQYISSISGDDNHLEYNVDLHPDDYNSGFGWYGAGITWKYTGGDNLLKNSSFDSFAAKFLAPVIYKSALGPEFAMRIKPTEIAYSKHLQGGKVRLLHAQNQEDSDGEIIDVQPLVFRQPRVMNNDYQGRVLAAAFRNNDNGGTLDTVLCGTDGLVIYNAQSKEAQVMPTFTEENLSRICSSDFGYIILTEQGKVWLSSDGQHWHRELVNTEIVHVASSPDKFLLIGKNGQTIWINERWTILPGENDAGHQFKKLIYYNGDFLAYDNKGELIIVREGGIENVPANWQYPRIFPVAIGVYGNSVVIMAADGYIWQGNFIDGFKTLNKTSLWQNLSLPKIEVQDILIFAENQIAILLRDGGLWYFDYNEQLFSLLEPQNDHLIQALLLPEAGLLTVDEKNKIIHYQLTARLNFSGNKELTNIQTGDRIIFWHQLYDEKIRFWQANNAHMEIVRQENPGKVEDYLRFQPNSGQVGLLQQKISLTKENWLPRMIYKLSFKARLNPNEKFPPDENLLQVDLSGSIRPQQFKFTDLGKDWRQFEAVFVSDSDELVQPAHLNFNLSTANAVDIDDLYCGLQDDDAVGSARAKILAELKPATLDLSGVNIGRDGFREYNWLTDKTDAGVEVNGKYFQVQGYPLVRALNLADEVKAVPWLAINPYASANEISALLEYLQGDTYSFYGNKRMEQGRTAPWAIAFPRFYIEFVDTDNNLRSDKERADIVDSLIHKFKISPYYPELKNKLIFVDGMNYVQNEKLSSADEHSSALPINFAAGLDASSTYQALLNISPRQSSFNEIRNGRELIKLTHIRNSMGNVESLAKLVQLALAGRGKLITRINYLLPEKITDDELDLLKSLMDILQPKVGGLHLLNLRQVPEISNISTEVRNHIDGFGLINNNGQIDLVFTNNSKNDVNLKLHPDKPGIRAWQRNYDENGRILGERKIVNDTVEVKIKAGGVVVLQGETEKDD